MKGILGRKLGMTQVFTIEGTLIPVTVVEVKPNVVLQKKTKDVDGYEAVQLGYEDVKEQRSNKPAIGHAKKANTAPKKFIKEFNYDEMLNLEVGSEVKQTSSRLAILLMFRALLRDMVTTVQSFVTMLTRDLRHTVDPRTSDTKVH